MSKPVTVIMLGHKSLVGKDTFFEFAKEGGYVRAAFADKLKNTVMDLYNFSYEQMHGELKDIPDERYKNTIDFPYYWDNGFGREDLTEKPSKETSDLYECGVNTDYRYYFTPRRVLQLFGQQQRSLFPDIWASYIFNTEITTLVNEGKNKIIITDFRFKNEAKVAQNWLSNNNNNKLFFVKINRDILAKSGAGDISENDLNDYQDWNLQIENNGSLLEYKEKVLSIIKPDTLETSSTHLVEVV